MLSLLASITHIVFDLSVIMFLCFGLFLRIGSRYLSYREADIKSWDVWMESVVDPLPILLMLAEIHQDRTPSSQFSVFLVAF